MKDLTCPYCKTENDVPDDCHESSEIYDAECEACHKIFGFEIEYYPTYSEREMPCKNGENHKFRMTAHHREGFCRGYCEYCHQTKSMQIEKKDCSSQNYILEAHE